MRCGSYNSREQQRRPEKSQARRSLWATVPDEEEPTSATSNPPTCQRESHIQSLEPVPKEIPLFAKEGKDGLFDLTQSSDDDDSATEEAANRMPQLTEFFLPEPYTTSVLQTGAADLGSALKADRSYKKEELDPFFTTVICSNPPTDPFDGVKKKTTS